MKNKYASCIITNLLLIIDALLLIFISQSTIGLMIYIAINTVILIIYGLIEKEEKVNELTIYMILTYTFTIEILIHYLSKNIFLEVQYLSIIPMIVVLVKKIKQKKSIETGLIISSMIFLIYFFVTIMQNSCDFLFILKTSLPYVYAIILFYDFHKTNQYMGDIYKRIYVVCVCITIIQTALGFNVDTRNGLFGVFGMNAYSLFLIIYPIYIYSMWLEKKKNIYNVIISSIITLLVLIMIENKTLVIGLFLIYATLPVFQKKITIKKMIVPVIMICMIPVIYKAILVAYPKFSYLISFEKIYEYFFRE